MLCAPAASAMRSPRVLMRCAWARCFTGRPTAIGRDHVFRTDPPPMGAPREIVAALAYYANCGSSDFTLGMVIEVGDGSRPIVPTDLFFDVLPRYLDWMGLARELPRLAGREAHLFMGMGADTPLSLVAVAPGRLDLVDSSLPDGPFVAMLRGLLERNGVVAVSLHHPRRMVFPDGPDSLPDWVSPHLS